MGRTVLNLGLLRCNPVLNEEELYVDVPLPLTFGPMTIPIKNHSTLVILVYH